MTNTRRRNNSDPPAHSLIHRISPILCLDARTRKPHILDAKIFLNSWRNFQVSNNEPRFNSHYEAKNYFIVSFHCFSSSASRFLDSPIHHFCSGLHSLLLDGESLLPSNFDFEYKTRCGIFVLSIQGSDTYREQRVDCFIVWVIIIHHFHCFVVSKKLWKIWGEQLRNRRPSTRVNACSACMSMNCKSIWKMNVSTIT